MFQKKILRNKAFDITIHICTITENRKKENNKKPCFVRFFQIFFGCHIIKFEGYIFQVIVKK